MFDPLFLPENVVRARATSSRRCGPSPRRTTRRRRRSRSAWVISHPNVVAIPGASSVAQLEANVAAADLELSADEIAELTAASDVFVPVRGASGAAKMVARRDQA